MSSDDQQKVIKAIEILVETCKASKDAISNHSQSTEAPHLLPVLHKDLLSLLSLVYGSVTKLSLALKPSSPTYSACLAPLKDLSDRIAAISHCINMFNASLHGATLVKEVGSSAIDVIETVQTLATVFMGSSGGRPSSGNEYLIRTGAVHSIIEMARSEDGLPKDNLTAVRRHWSKDSDALEDGLREVGEMIEDAESEINLGSGDGWDELGIEPSKPLNDQELKIANKVLTVLRLCSLLHRKVISDILSTPDSLPNSFLDDLASLSPVLLSTSDELISTLDPPQDLDAVTTELNALKGVIDDIRNRLSVLNNRPNSLAGLLKETSLNDVYVSTNRNTREKWFNACFDQISKAIQSAAEAANGT